MLGPVSRSRFLKGKERVSSKGQGDTDTRERENRALVIVLYYWGQNDYMPKKLF